MAANGTASSTAPHSVSWAIKQDEQDSLRRFRDQFHIPSKADLKSSTLRQASESDQSSPSLYLCGNSLGLQPKNTARLIQDFLAQWRTKGVLGHFLTHDDTPLAPFLHIDDYAAKLMAPVVGAQEHEVAVMGTLTGNLHLLMTSFYRPERTPGGRHKILLEGKAFPSDHFAIESQISLAGFNPQDAMIMLEPEDSNNPTLTTNQIVKAIDQHAHELALIMLPGIQFYTGQLFDIKTITAHARKLGIPIGWDCAHAAGNVDLQLHSWDVDFAVWCTYKYLNSGPGAMAGIFVHDRHGKVEQTADGILFRPRLTGWWGDDKSTRFKMTNKFIPRPGAAGFQLSNPSALDLAAVTASLQIFGEATMPQLRQKSLRLTHYLERLLTDTSFMGENLPYSIITPTNPQARGAQLSIRLRPGLLEKVLEVLEEHGVVIDERKPDVIRVAPAPLYNSFQDVLAFCETFRAALRLAQDSGKTREH